MTVDPKAVEAIANEEPPPYEPTDTEPPPEETDEKNESKTNEFVEEVIEEDAEEEQQEQQRRRRQQKRREEQGKEQEEEVQAADQEAAIDDMQPSMSLWPDEEVHETMHVEYHEEPNKEDFFHQPEDEAPAPIVQTTREEPAAISLVPTQSKSKAKRPKFARSAPRKKK